MNLNPIFSYKRTYASIKVPILSGNTSSSLIDCGGMQLRRMVFPSSWTNCNVTIQVSEDSGSNLPNTVESALLVDTGVGYPPGDILTVIGGTFTVAAQITVDSSDSDGRIITYHVSNIGHYSVFPENPVSVSGSGNSASFNLSTGTDSLNTVLQNFDGNISGNLVIPANSGTTIPLYAHWFDSIPYLQIFCDQTQTSNTYCLLVLEPIYQGIHG